MVLDLRSEVTGRILSDLRRLMGDFGLFDAIVAENGAVLTFPHTGRSSILCNPPPPIFVERLRQLGKDIVFLGIAGVDIDAVRGCFDALLLHPVGDMQTVQPATVVIRSDRVVDSNQMSAGEHMNG